MDNQQRMEILRVARDTIAEELRGNLTPVKSDLAFPSPPGGAFVTLRRAQRLRGCMGTFSPKATILETIDYVARLACRDPRFATQPVTIDELPELTLEVSLLSALRITDSPEALNVGEHGIVVRCGQASGCFLPQVAVEHQWNAEQFLDQCCTGKAGLPTGAWRQSDAEVSLFTAEVFGE